MQARTISSLAFKTTAATLIPTEDFIPSVSLPQLQAMISSVTFLLLLLPSVILCAAASIAQQVENGTDVLLCDYALFNQQVSCYRMACIYIFY